MLALIFSSGVKVALSLLLAVVLAGIFPSLAALGGDGMQSRIVLAFYVYCFLVLFWFSSHKLFHVLSIPVLTQFLHLYQKYDFPAGANSLWRLLPFVFVDFYLVDFCLSNKISLSKHEKLFLTLWVAANFLYLVISPNFGNLLGGGILLYLVTLPLYFVYLRTLSRTGDFGRQLEISLAAAYLMLALGTFGLVIAGAHYVGSNNLLATRNISDTNVTMAYFILLWPFALQWGHRTQVAPTWVTLALAGMLAGIVMVSFSRGAVLIVLPYLACSMMPTLLRKFWLIGAFMPIAFFLVLKTDFQWQEHELAYFWQLRFEGMHSLSEVWGKFQEVSGRAEIHRIAWELFRERPLTGHGTGSFEVLGPGFREAHSLFYTFVAEQGITGTCLIYWIFSCLATALLRCMRLDMQYAVFCLGLAAYLLFVHVVGTVFIVLPAHSITVNCIAPVLLLCMYFHAENTSCLAHLQDLNA